MPDPKTLSEAIALFGAYPEDHPQTLQELLDADPDALQHPLAWFLRTQAVGVSRAAEQHYINGPADAFKLLRNKYVLHPWRNTWTSYALAENRQVVMVAHKLGGMTPLHKRTALIPKFDDLPRLPHARTGAKKTPAWLVIYGNNPDVLSKPGVARGLSTLQKRLPVADVLFYDSGKDSGTPPTCWSLRAGTGIQENGSASGLKVEFPNLTALNEASTTT